MRAKRYSTLITPPTRSPGPAGTVRSGDPRFIAKSQAVKNAEWMQSSVAIVRVAAAHIEKRGAPYGLASDSE